MADDAGTSGDRLGRRVRRRPRCEPSEIQLCVRSAERLHLHHLVRGDGLRRRGGADYSVSALVDYNILAANEKSSYKETISLSLLKESLAAQGKNETEIEAMIKDTDFSKNFVCNKVEISCDKGYENQLYGTIVKWGENSYIIDRSGNCALTATYPVNQPLTLIELGSGWEHATIILTVTENLLEETAPKLKPLFGYSVNGFEQAGADLFKINTSIYSIVDIEYKLLPVAKVFSDDAIQRLFVNSGY